MNYGGQNAGQLIGGPDRYVSGSGGGSGTQAATPAPSPVMLAQKQLDDATNGLHTTITALLDRLQPVLGPSKPVNDSLNSPPPSSVAARIAQSASAVNSAASRLGDIIDRLEV